jgi:hypothetical protein
VAHAVLVAPESVGVGSNANYGVVMARYLRAVGVVVARIPDPVAAALVLVGAIGFFY